jgi:ATP-dependent DNA helicase RecG
MTSTKLLTPKSLPLKGIGPAVLKRLQTLGIHSLADLRHHYPTRYHDFSVRAPIAEAPLDTAVTLQAIVKKIATKRSWQRRRFSLVNATVADESGEVKVVWFNQNYIAEHLTVGTAVLLSGKIKQTKYGKQLVNPVFEKVKSDTMHTGRIVPHYPTTYRLTQKQLRFFISQALEQPYTDWLPADMVETYDLLPYQQALHTIHFPDDITAVGPAKRRLAFDELLTMQLISLQLRASLQQEQAKPITLKPDQLKQFTSRLPFQLTLSQLRVAQEIIEDLGKPQPMNRLLEGDVGAGKTVVAAIALFAVAQAGLQAVLMAPTEVLAVQHYRKIIELLEPLGVEVGIMTAHHKVHTAADILIGTQALLTDQTLFSKLALAIIDEQHRFGVAQRQLLKQKSGLDTTPHLLSMTATPIPRTLALTAYGDLTLSIIDELPKNRVPIQTSLVTDAQRLDMYQKIQEQIQAGQQVYVVAPRIEEDTTSEKTSVEQEAKRIAEHFPQAKLGVLHGQLKAKEKQLTMDQFRRGQIDILVSTTVIEVGVDVPNATVIVIENAELFGLAQLHQLRGRVGRADMASFCFVCTPAQVTVAQLERLEFFANTRSGFALAEYDLERRGPGDVYGREQSGFLKVFKLAKLSDHKLLKQAQTAGQQLFPDLKQYPAIEQRIALTLSQVHLE